MEKIEMPYIVKLEKPVTHGDKEITELVLPRELCAGDLRGIPVHDLRYDHIGLIVSRLTGLPPSVIDKVSLTDFGKVSQVVSSFL